MVAFGLIVFSENGIAIINANYFYTIQPYEFVQKPNIWRNEQVKSHSFNLILFANIYKNFNIL
jgi:hypothetical protein